MIYLYLFLEFFKIGLFTFGGGYAMIPLVREVVLKYRWMTEETFSNFIGVCESTPGPIAVNMATYVGSTTGGFFGSVLATLGVVLPSMIIIILILTLLKTLTQNKHFVNALKGIKPVVLGLIFSTGLILVFKALGYKSTRSFAFDWKSFIILGIICLIYFLYQKIQKKKLSTILLILISACIGIIISII
jgi:chromate transporter